MKKHFSLFIALFFISVAMIAYELDVMRVFSVSSWSSFGSMVISIALLGYGVAGTLLTFLQKRFRKNAIAWLQVTALCLGPVMALSYILAQYVPFNPVLLVNNSAQILWIAVYYVLYALPFFIGAMFIGIAFTVLSDGVHSLYFWNMAGSGIGGFLLLGFMYLMPVKSLIIPILILAAVGAFVIIFFRNSNAAGAAPSSLSQMSKQTVLGLVLAVAACVVAIIPTLIWGNLKPSQFKSVELAKVTFSDLEQMYSDHSPLGEIEVYRSSQLHFAPGLSDNVIFYIDEMPKDAFWAIFIDGNGPINIMRELTEEEKIYLDFLPMAAPYQVLDKPSVFISHLGGGFSAFSALHQKAEEITVVEPNTALVSMMKETRIIREFQGDLLNDPRINIVEQEPRAHAKRNEGKYDLVEISLIDSLGLSQSVGNPLYENYTYTTDAVDNYMHCLNPDGILSITTWNHLAPPRNVPKLLTTVIDSLQGQGIEEPGKHLYVFQLIYSTATVLVKKTPFTPEEIDKLNQFTYKMSFETVYYHGIDERLNHLDEQLAAYTAKYDRITENDVMGDEVSRPMGDLYYHTIVHKLKNKESVVYDGYLFDITPATDNRPYFTSYLKPNNIGMFLDKLDAVSEEWSYLLLLGTLLQSVIFGVIIIVIPAIGGRKSQLKGTKGKFGVILYYSFLGIAYMLVEIFFIQKLVFYLGNPVFSASIVITSMLIISGVGSLAAGKIIKQPKRFLLICAGIVVATMVFYITALPAILEGSLGAPVVIKMITAILLIAPAAFFMGMFFPTGLRNLAMNRAEMLPWAWGMNGAFSVTGSLLARFLAVQYGFRVLLIAALVVYAAAGLLFPVNMKQRKESAA